MSQDNLSQEDIDALLAGGVPSGSTKPAEVSPVAKSDQIQDYEEQAKSYAVAKPLQFSPLVAPSKKEKMSHNIDLILDVNVELSAELGRKTMMIKDILELGSGSILELNKLAGEPVDLLVNNKLLARGEVVVINENFGIRIIDIVGPEQRIKNLK